MSQALDSRIDRLYKLLPAIYRMRDAAEEGYALQAFLRVIAEQVSVVEDNIGQLYEDWFIETAEDWAVPYIADLIGYQRVIGAASTGDASTEQVRALNRILVPRREVANTIRYRRRKGTLAVLEQLARDVAGWPSHAVEFFKLLGWAQNLNHQHPERARLVDIRDTDALDLIDDPFDGAAHTVEVRRPQSHRVKGRSNIPSVGLCVWRLKPYSLTEAPAYCAENAGPHCYTFSVLGQDAPLYVWPSPGGAGPSGELGVPAPIRRVPFDRHKERFYGPGKSMTIWAEGWPYAEAPQPVPASAVIPADLSDWQYVPPKDHVAADPVLGRFAFPPSQLPRKGVRVTYHTAFSDDMGGGEYGRTLSDPSPREVDGAEVAPTYYRVGRSEQFHRIGEAIGQWRQAKPLDAVIELMDSGGDVEPIYGELAEGQSLQLRAASGVRPTIRLLDWQTDLPDALGIVMAEGSRFMMDGLLITGRAVHITGPARDGRADLPPVCQSDIIIRHCTLVPGWGIDCDCEPKRPAEPSLELYNVRARLFIDHSIIGSIQVHENEVTQDPIPVSICDSILDAMEPGREAIGSPGYPVAHARVTIRRATVWGVVDVHAIELAENSIFMDCLNVARRQIGCMRFCYVPTGCRTPRRYHCQPDMVVETAKQADLDPAQQRAAVAGERQRVRPQFTSDCYGLPAYAQLSLECAEEIRRGASDESEMGAFHNLYQPQREAILAARLNEFTPAGLEAGIIFAS